MGREPRPGVGREIRRGDPAPSPSGNIEAVRRESLAASTYVRESFTLSIAIAAGIGLVIIAIIGILIMTGVIGRAGERNQNRTEDEEDRARKERESGEQNPRGGGSS